MGFGAGRHDAGCPSSRATSDTWNGADGTWATNANWLTTPAVVPGTGDTATFTHAGFATVIGGGAIINTLAFNATALPFNVSGLNLDAGGAINVTATAGAETLATITANGSSTITTNGTLSLGLTHAIAGTTLTFDGTGTTTSAGSLRDLGTAGGVGEGPVPQIVHRFHGVGMILRLRHRRGQVVLHFGSGHFSIFLHERCLALSFPGGGLAGRRPAARSVLLIRSALRAGSAANVRRLSGSAASGRRSL